MKVQFKDGTLKKCINAAEQKIYRNGKETGWLCSFRITDTMSSSDIDSLLTSENISEITFVSEDSSVTENPVLTGYEKLSSVVIRHNDAGTYTEIQLTKGV